MPWLDVIWTDDNEAHLLEHDIRREEAEYVIRNPIGHDTSESSERPIAFGYTASGRKLAIVYELLDEITVYPITGYEVD